MIARAFLICTSINLKAWFWSVAGQASLSPRPKRQLQMRILLRFLVFSLLQPFSILYIRLKLIKNEKIFHLPGRVYVSFPDATLIEKQLDHRLEHANFSIFHQLLLLFSPKFRYHCLKIVIKGKNTTNMEKGLKRSQFPDFWKKRAPAPVKSWQLARSY